MSRKLFNTTLAALCTAALLFAVAVGVEAQSDEPLFEEDLVCSIQSGPKLWIAPVFLWDELENHLGARATIEPLGLLLQRMPAATMSNSVHFEGGYPSQDVSSDLDDLGYTVQTLVTPSLQSANTAVTCTE